MTEQPLDDNQAATRGMLKELKVEMKAEIKAEITALEIRQMATAVETRRHFDVVGEGLRDDIRRLADGVAANTVAIQQLATSFESSNERSALVELRVDDHERQIRGLKKNPRSHS